LLPLPSQCCDGQTKSGECRSDLEPVKKLRQNEPRDRRGGGGGVVPRTLARSSYGSSCRHVFDCKSAAGGAAVGNLRGPFPGLAGVDASPASQLCGASSSEVLPSIADDDPIPRTVWIARRKCLLLRRVGFSDSDQSGMDPKYGRS